MTIAIFAIVVLQLLVAVALVFGGWRLYLLERAMRRREHIARTALTPVLERISKRAARVAQRPA